MLSRLHVNNYVLIDSLDISFPEGLIIITGQTGAGKSILLGALGLALGAKADASVIGEGDGNCVVEAEFSVDSAGPALSGFLEENDIDPDDGHLLIRRVVNRSGRSRSFINDSPVTVQVLSSLASRLIDIHSQHQTLQLSDAAFRLSMLDSYAGNASLLEEFHEAYARMSCIRAELESVRAALERARNEKDYNEARFRQLDSASLKDGELESLEAEQKQLANAEEIKESLCAAVGLCSGDQASDMPGIDSMLREAEKHLSKVSRYVPSVSSLSDRLASCRVELDDIISEVAELDSRTEVSQERLQAVEDRLSFLYGLMQKFGCSTVAELIAERDSLSGILGDTSGMESRCEELSSMLDKTELAVVELSGRLHDSRVSAASAFSEAISEAVRRLELPYSVFEVEVRNVPLSRTGSDSVDFLFSASGRNPVDVSKCASGGEMSRIMLSLKAVMANYMDMPALVFDEIDTGVSGSVADKMGSMICDMGQNMQVFAITHLPQVAAKGNAHYLVSKDIDPHTSKAATTIKRLSDGQRVLEVARLLSGSEVTDAAIANARSLLSGN